MRIAVAAFVIVFAVAAGYVVAGSLNDLRARYVERRLDAARRALATVLFDDDEHAARAFLVVRRLPRAWLFRIAQGVLVDLGDATHERLRQVIAASGAARRIRALGRRRSWTKRVQGAQLLHLLPPGDPLRDRLLGDSHPMVRAQAIESMSASDIADRARLVLELLGDDHRPVRIAAQQALLRADPRVLPEVAHFLAATDDQRATLALEVAANRPDSSLLDALLRHAADAAPERRVLVARALGAMPFTRTEETLLALLDDDDATVRAAAARSAGRMKLTDAAARLGTLLSDESFAVRREAGLALDALDAAGAAVLRAHLFDRDRYARDMARQVLDAAAIRRRMPPVLLPEALREISA